MSNERPTRKRIEPMVLKPVGVISSPYRTMDEAPFQGRFSEEKAVLEIYDEFEDCLEDVEVSEYLIVLYWAHLANREVMKTVTPWGPEIRGVFACRSPSRPNPLQFCVVELLERDRSRLTVRGLDAVDGSRVLDIKPYSSRIDSICDVRIGWFKDSDDKPVGL